MLRPIVHRVRDLARDERGLSTVEYVVLLVLIVAMAVAAWQSFGSNVNGKLTQASGSFDTTVSAGAVTPAGGGPGAQTPPNPGSSTTE